MTHTKNELPVAVHIESGGDARVRSGGTIIPLEGVSGGSFQVVNATRYRFTFSNRSVGGLMAFIGYTNPLTVENASLICRDMEETADDVPAGTTVYFTLINPADLQPTTGGAGDYVYVSFYA